MKNFLIILLGSHVPSLLNDRVETAVNFVHMEEPTSHIHWYVSGGVTKSKNTVSEAVIMANMVTEKQQSGNWSFIYDTNASNTAENFINIKDKIHEFDNVLVVTSAFHEKRAKAIASLIIPMNNFRWILGNEVLPDSYYWEKIHMVNVESDVQKAMKNKEYDSSIKAFETLDK